MPSYPDALEIEQTIRRGALAAGPPRLLEPRLQRSVKTDQQFPGIDNNKPAMIQNDDGSYDVYFGPTAPDGQENNWVQTMPSKGYSVIFRLYGPLKPWFDKTWRPSEIELVQ